MRWRYRSTHRPEPHRHDFHELFWVERGAGIHFLNGAALPLKPGDLFLVRAPDAHGFAAAPGEALEFVNVTLRAPVWDRVRAAHFRGRRVLFSAPADVPLGHRLAPERIARLDMLSADLRAGHWDRLAVESFLLGVLSMLAPRPMAPAGVPVPDWLRRAGERLAEHPNFCAGPGALARLAGRSPEHVARSCRRFLGKRPSDLVNEARLRHAAQLLAETDMPIIEIAMDCGLENLGHFYALCRRGLGAAPGVWRRQHASAAAG